MDFFIGDDDHFAEAVSRGIEGIQLLGPEMVLGKLFGDIAFGAAFGDPLFGYLVLSRLVFSLSKLKTTEYLLRYNGLEIDVERIYRFKYPQQYSPSQQFQSLNLPGAQLPNHKKSPRPQAKLLLQSHSR